jgi:hypothetical protein
MVVDLLIDISTVSGAILTVFSANPCYIVTKFSVNWKRFTSLVLASPSHSSSHASSTQDQPSHSSSSMKPARVVLIQRLHLY